MNMTANQYQKQLDTDGELDIAVERYKKDCRESLLNLQSWEYPKVVNWLVTVTAHVGDDDLNEHLGEYHEDLSLAGALLDSNPVESIRMLDECRRKAVEDVLGRMDFEAIVKAISEQECAA